MCGIAGLFELDGSFNERSGAVASRMADQLEHRGPNDAGLLHQGPLAFGFRRLSVIDLETGHQPMSNPDGSVWVMLNGEVYNYVELRTALESRGHTFRTNSDTETVICAYAEHGLDFVDHLRGMFAIALWDQNRKRLVLVRDRLGQKPLFYAQAGGQLAFASEQKALLPWPHLDRSLDPEALHDYLTFLYVPSPSSIFSSVRKLPAAHMLIASAGQALKLRRYWNVVPRPEADRTEADWQRDLHDTLSEAVRLRLRSDVPLGAFLSGGIDSTVITSLMCEHAGGSSEVETFSIGFADSRFDESGLAKRTASAFGTRHTTEVIDDTSLTPRELEVLTWHMDEPFGDSSFIPTYWVSRSARKHVTVALSGDGGDELFAGYHRYRRFQQLEGLARLPRSVNRAGELLSGSAMRCAMPLAPALGERLRQIEKAFAIGQLEPAEQMLALVTYFDESSKAKLYSRDWQAQPTGYRSIERVVSQLAALPPGGSSLARFMARDVTSNMIDDALVKVDRASMACSLEVRNPFLDHKVVELALRIPLQYKIRQGTQKWILRRTFAGEIPEHIKGARKRGFEVPFAVWFQRAPWRDFVIDTLSPASIHRAGIFDSEEVLKLRDALLRDPEARGVALSAYQLRHRVWMLLVFQIWWQQFVDRPARPATRPHTSDRHAEVPCALPS